MVTPEEILDFWFGPRATNSEIAGRQAGLWWGKSESVDRGIVSRFGDAVDCAARGRFEQWCDDADGRLAVIILLDQFSRQVYRDTPRAFSNDTKALSLALEGIEAGHDRLLTPIRRVFFYLPLEHSESLEHQARNIELFTALAEGADEGEKATFEGYLDYARRHHVVVERFGRFPHRNTIMGRESTPEEIEFLKQPGTSF